MDTQTLFIHPDTLVGRAVAYHPFVDIMAAGGTCDGDGAVLFFYSQADIEKQPFQHCNLQQYHGKVSIEKKLVQRTPSYPEETLPLNSVLELRFSPCGRFLAVLGSDTESEKIIIYRFAPLAIKKRKISLFKRIDTTQQFCDIIWSPDSSFIAAGTLTGDITLLPVRTKMANYNIDYDQVRTCNKTHTIKALPGPVLGMTWSRCGFLLAVQGYNEVQIIVCKNCKNSVVFRRGEAIQWFRHSLYFKNGFRMEQRFMDTKYSKKYVHEVGLTAEKYNMLFLEKGSEKYITRNTGMRTIYAVATYKREPSFSPDASFLVVPCGVIEQSSRDGRFEADAYATLVYTKTAYSQGHQDPSILLPGHRYPSTCVAFSPCMYELDKNRENLTDLRYEMLFAVAAGCDVYVYSTQDFKPLFEFVGESFESDYISSLGWSADGSELCAFGAHFQYQFFKITSERLFSVDFSLGIATLAQDSMAAHEKAEYATKIISWRTRCQERQKKTAPPPKPRMPAIDFGGMHFEQHFKVFSVTDYLTTDIESEPLLHFEPGELEELVSLVSDTIPRKSSEGRSASQKNGSQSVAQTGTEAEEEESTLIEDEPITGDDRSLEKANNETSQPVAVANALPSIKE